MAPWGISDQKIPQGRLALFSYLSVILVAMLLVGFWKLQVVQSDHFADLAEKNRVRYIPIIAPRGAMLDREGRVLADSYPSFSILLLRDDPKQVQKELPRIEEGLGISADDLRQQLEEAKSEPKFQPVVIKPAASDADIAFVESHRIDLPMLELMMVQRRRYPHGEMLANTIGYVGEVSPEDMDDNPDKYRPGDIVGKAGLEKEYNDQLEGTDGLRRAVVNSVGKMVRSLDDVDATPGKPIQLTIDYDLQSVAEADFANKEGALIAMDARTGAVLAIVSRPTFDPNDFTVRIPTKEWAELNSDPQDASPESRHSGAARSRLGLQSRDGHRDARVQGDPRELHRVLSGFSRLSTAARSTAITLTAWSIFTKASSRPATSTFITSASCSGSIGFHTMRWASASAGAPELICPARSPALFRPRIGSSVSTITNGIRVPRFRCRSAREP